MAKIFHPAGLSKKIALTLAEVLITLGIIGVVAALTMPSLIQNHKKHAIETSLKKFYSAMNQAIKLSEIENGPATNWEAKNDGSMNASPENWYYKYLNKYLKTVRVDKFKSKYILGEVMEIYLADGSLMLLSAGSEVWFYPKAKDFNKETFVVVDDNNNSTVPDNGRKFFTFEFTEPKSNGQVIAYADCRDGLWCSYTSVVHNNLQITLEPFLYCYPEYDKNKNRVWHCPTTDEELSQRCSTTASNNYHCAALIQKNGWKIPKNYPFKF